jgi:hypothetical protein
LRRCDLSDNNRGTNNHYHDYLAAANNYASGHHHNHDYDHDRFANFSA